MNFFILAFYGTLSLSYLIPAFVTFLILRLFNHGLLRSLMLVPLLLALSVMYMYLMPNLFPILGVEFGMLAAFFSAVIGFPIGLVFLITLLYVSDKARKVGNT